MLPQKIGPIGTQRLQIVRIVVAVVAIVVAVVAVAANQRQLSKRLKMAPIHWFIH